MQARLDGAVAVVTGAGRGIGAAAALELGRLGARLVPVARTDAEIIEAAKVMAIHGAEVLPIIADVTQEDQVERVFREARERFGPVTHLVNNAGGVVPSPLASQTLAGWRETIDANLTSTFLCTRAALADMLAKKQGRIVNVASVSGVSNVEKYPGFVAYASAKAAVIAFTEALAAEVGPSGVRVLAISPGSVDTRLFRRVAPGVTAAMKVDEVARVVAFLCSPEAGIANGSNLVVMGR